VPEEKSTKKLVELAKGQDCCISFGVAEIEREFKFIFDWS